MSYADFHVALNDIMGQLKSKLGVSNAIIRRLEGDELKTVAHFGFGEEEAHVRIYLGQGVTGRCAKENTIIVINDLDSYKGQYISGIDNARAEICVPMTISGRLVGTFNIESTVKDNFTKEKIELITRMAAMLAPNVASIQSKAGTSLARALANLESRAETGA